MAGEQKGRVIKKGISMDKRIARLKSVWAKLLYTWCIPHLDNLGRMEADPDLLKGTIFPRENYVDSKKLAIWAQEIHDNGLFFLYLVNGEAYFQCPTTDKNLFHRHDRERASDIPTPPEKQYEEWLKNIRNCQRQDTAGHDRTLLTHSMKGREGNRKGIGKEVDDIILYLNKKSKKTYRTDTEANRKGIYGRLEKFTIADCKKVIDIKVAEWLGDAEMDKHLCPETLFRPSKFEKYLNQCNIKSKTDLDDLEKLDKEYEDKT